MKQLLIVLIVVIVIVAGVTGFVVLRLTNEPTPQQSTLALSFAALDPLNIGQYRLWAQKPDGSIAGILPITSRGVSGGLYTVPLDVTDASELFVTIEAETSVGDLPNGIEILRGTVVNGVAEMHFVASLEDAAGSYMLATPTNDPEPFEESGVWFAEENKSGAVRSSLALPELPSGWVYEGWVVHQGSVFSTGRFQSPTTVDMQEQYGGDAPGLPFPGEDFVVSDVADTLFPTELTDGATMVLLSVEPDMDGVDPTGDTPFPIKLLTGIVPFDAQPRQSYQMTRGADEIPRGRVTIQS